MRSKNLYVASAIICISVLVALLIVFSDFGSDGSNELDPEDKVSGYSIDVEVLLEYCKSTTIDKDIKYSLIDNNTISIVFTDIGDIHINTIYAMINRGTSSLDVFQDNGMFSKDNGGIIDSIPIDGLTYYDIANSISECCDKYYKSLPECEVSYDVGQVVDVIVRPDGSLEINK